MTTWPGFVINIYNDIDFAVLVAIASVDLYGNEVFVPEDCWDQL